MISDHKISGGFAFQFFQISQLFEWLMIKREGQHAILIAGARDRDVGLKSWLGWR